MKEGEDPINRLKSRTLLAGMVLVVTACGGTADQPPATGDTAPTTAAGPTTVAPDTTAPATTAGEKPAVVIGLITDLTGRFVSFGKDIELATNLAVEQVNEEGGINGSLVEVQIADTGGEPDQAVISYRDLADRGVFAISGPLSSGEAEVLFPQAPEVQVPLITGTANKEGITDPGQGWAFRNTATNTALYTVAMPAWAEAYGVETAVLVFDEEEPVTAAAAMFSIPGVAPNVGVEIVNADAPITFTSGQTDFSTTVQRITEVEADGLIIMSAPAEAGLIARELVRQGEVRPVLGHPAQAGNTFFEQGGSDINDWVLPSILDPVSGAPATADYVAMITAADPEPPTVPEAANYFDNILLLAQVMRDAGIDGLWEPADARQAIREGLLGVQGFQGVAGEISFQENGDAVKTVYVNVVLNGELQPLE
ncbi:ABC transporter substrate-binding protein [soil metagenome]